MTWKVPMPSCRIPPPTCCSPTKAFDADARVIEPSAAANKFEVIPSKSNRTRPRTYDNQLYKERHLIENFFCKSQAKFPRHRHAP